VCVFAAVFSTSIMMLCGTSIVCSTLVLCLRHSDPSRRAPAWLRRLLLQHVARLLLMKCADNSSNKRYPTDVRVASELTHHVEQTPQSKKVNNVPTKVRHLDAMVAPSRPSATTPPSTTDAGHRSMEYAVDPVLSPSSAWHNTGHQNAIIAGEGQEDTYIYRFQDNNNDEVNDVIPTSGEPVTTPSEDTHTAFDNLLEWHTMGRVLDRLFFVIFLTVTIVVTSTLAFIYAFCSPTTVELTPAT